MAPALTETASDGCGIHLSSPGVNLDGSLLGMEVDQQQILMEDDCTQAAWLNLTFLPSPDTCSKDTLEVQTPFLSPLVQSSGSYRTMLHSSPGTLLNLLSLNKSLASPLLPSPQSPDVYFLSVSDHDGMGSERTFRNMSTQQPLLTECCLGEDETQAQTARPLLPWGKMGRKAGWHQDQAQPRSVVLEEAFLSQVQQCCSRQHTLLRQTTRVQRRLQALLGEHATRHCSLQLHGLIRTCFEGDAPPGSPFPLEPHSPLDKKPFNTPIGLEDGEERGPWSNITLSSPPQKVPSPLKRPADVKTFVCCTKAVMSGLQDVLDSDATDSSSDEEWNLEGAQGANCVPICQGCEWRWQKERAEIGSRWTWLQVRVSELELQIQWLNDLQQQINSTKGGVVLAETQPLTNKQGQQVLLLDTTDCDTPSDSHDFTSDLELEPSSPTQLLRNIERQSAQLTQIVNSLMSPFSYSPSSSPTSKPTCRWRGRSKRGLCSDQCLQGDPLFPGQVGLKRRRVCRRRQKLPQLDSTCVSARTRPLLTYHKPRLFTLDPLTCPRRQQGLEPKPSCNPPVTYAHPSHRTKTRRRGMCERLEQLRPHPVISLTSETPLPVLLQSTLFREDWVPQVAPVKTEELSPYCCTNFDNKEACFPALNKSGQSKVHHGKRSRRGCGEGPPVRWTSAAEGRPRLAWQGGRKRGHSSGAVEDGTTPLSHLSELSFCLPPTPEDSPPELMTPRTKQTLKQPSQSSARRRLRGECFYNIDNIVIPMSLAASSKVERLQYKDILTPSWRIVNILPLEEEFRGDEVEVLLDETFCLRHLEGEHREHLRWSSWGHGRSQRRSNRSSGSNNESGFDVDLSLSELAVQTECHCVHPAAHTDDRPQEYPVLLPWERRTFPLSEEEEEALRPEEDALSYLQSDSEGTESWSTDTCSEHSLSGTDCCIPAPPSGVPLWNI